MPKQRLVKFLTESAFGNDPRFKSTVRREHDTGTLTVSVQCTFHNLVIPASMNVYNIWHSIANHLAKYVNMLGYQLVVLGVKMLYVHECCLVLVFFRYLQLR